MAGEELPVAACSSTDFQAAAGVLVGGDEIRRKSGRNETSSPAFRIGEPYLAPAPMARLRGAVTAAGGGPATLLGRSDGAIKKSLKLAAEVSGSLS